MERRGLTLIEVLAVVAILAVLMAMALPAVENRLEGARFEAAQRGVEAAAVMARAEAMRRGTMVELVAQDVGHGETGLFVEPVAGENAGVEGTAEFESGAPPMGAGGTLPRASSGAGSGPARAGSADTGPGDAAAPSVVIGSGVVLTPHAPTGASSAGGVRTGLDGASEFPSTGSGEASDLRGDRAGAGVGPVVVARFMPDGSALAAGPVYLVGKRRAAAVSLNRWTGSAMVRVLDIQAAPGAGGGGDAGTEVPAGADQTGVRATSGDAPGAATGEPARAPDEDSPPREPGP
jgi:prepilin-type N-terminal cleavage/methylation domain-containing protein